MVVDTVGTAMFMLADDGRLQVFEASGAVAAAIFGAEYRKPLAKDEARIYQDDLIKLAERTAKDLAHVAPGRRRRVPLRALVADEGARRHLQGRARRHRTAPSNRAFRRYVQGLPVLGRASINVTLGGAHAAVTRWGIDWRRVGGKAIGETDVVEPAEGRRALADLQRRRPERPLTLADFKPRALQLGYVSLPRRQAQSLLEPAWVAILDPAGKQTTMGEVIAVPAAPDRCEPLFRPWRRATGAGRPLSPNASAG